MAALNSFQLFAARQFAPMSYAAFMEKVHARIQASTVQSVVHAAKLPKYPE